MDFSLTPDQRMMQDSLSRTLADASALDRVRRFAGDLTDTGGDVWKAVAEFGLPGIVIPEAFGGLGLGLLDAALASEALGRAVAPVPFLGVVLAPLALMAAGTPAQQADWLPKLATGEVLARLRDAGWTLIAADTLGACDAMIEKAVAYAKERKQFGRVIGSFQAVKHLCAEMAAETEPCRALVWYAGYAFDAVPEEASLTAAHAKAHTSEIGRFVARTATEVHGGMGITDLLGLHFWFKRVGLNRQLLGGPERVREWAARIQGLAA